MTLALRGLQLLCEGHYLPVQLLLREQPRTKFDVDLLQAAVGLVAELVPSQSSLGEMGQDGFDLVTLCVEFFVEALQGPCQPNQVLIANSEATVVAKRLILFVAADLPNHSRATAQGAAARLGLLATARCACNM